MLDMAFVRDNLARVEEMLRRRGMDPAQTLGGFRAVDDRRRQLITHAETLKAQRNRVSEEVAGLKKSGQNAAASAKPCSFSYEVFRAGAAAALAFSESCAKPAASFTAISANTLRSSATPAAFKP